MRADYLAPLLLTHEQFAFFVSGHAQRVPELEASSRLTHINRTSSETGACKSQLVLRLVRWVRQHVG